MNDNHEIFKTNLAESQEGIFTIARFLRERGLSVILPPYKVSPSHEKWKAYVDGGDLFVCHRVEVKSLGQEFSCHADWLFGDKFIVCARHSFDTAFPEIWRFMYLNKSKSYCAIVNPSSTKQYWYVEKKTDSRYTDYSQEFYICPTKYVTFKKL